MKVLVATHATQGWRDNDFCHAIEGELVSIPAAECDDEPVDGLCGCRRSLSGLVSLQGTTTARVVELDVNPDELVAIARTSLIDGGWSSLCDDDELFILTNELSNEMCVDDDFDAGDVIERRDGLFRRRTAQP